MGDELQTAVAIRIRGGQEIDGSGFINEVIFPLFVSSTIFPDRPDFFGLIGYLNVDE